MKRELLAVLLVLIVVALAGCVPSPNPMAYTAGADGNIAGFWLGLWHGVIFPFTFIASLFSDNVHVYEVYNNGGWYNFGFTLGLGVASGGSGSAASRRRKSK